MNREKAFELAVYLDSLGHSKNVVPVLVTITTPGGRKSAQFYGAQYDRVPFNNETWLYLLSNVEDIKSLYSRKHYFAHDGHDMYIAGYTTESSLQAQYRRYHPFGHHVQMTYWRSDASLDFNEATQEVHPSGYYPRLQVTIEVLNDKE